MKAQRGSQQLSSPLGMHSGANCALDSRNYKFSVSHTYKVMGQQACLLPAIIKIKCLFGLSIQSAQGQTCSSIQEQMGEIQHYWFGNIWVRNAGRKARLPWGAGVKSAHKSAETAQGIPQNRAGLGDPQPHVSPWSHPTALGEAWPNSEGKQNKTEASSSSRAGQPWPEIEHS